MSNRSPSNGLCSVCNGPKLVSICRGCNKLFCIPHLENHRTSLLKQVENIERQLNDHEKQLRSQQIKDKLSKEIKQWEADFIKKIQDVAKIAQSNVERSTQQREKQLHDLSTKFKQEAKSAKGDQHLSERSISSLKGQLDDFQKYGNELLQMQLIKPNPNDVSSIEIKMSDMQVQPAANASPRGPANVANGSNEAVLQRRLSRENILSPSATDPIHDSTPSRKELSSKYPSMIFGVNEHTNQAIKSLFDNLMLLPPMDKRGPMSGNCDYETRQMEQFLTHNFGFQNLHGKHIVDGVRSFVLGKPVRSMSPGKVLSFPENCQNSFQMKVEEIQRWQSTYRVYADKYAPGMSLDFLQRALQGKSNDGDEAFRMKFVVRISTCPILMEFDGKVIPRELKDDWPDRIKLVSVTGIDFAGRKHDVNDIRCYIRNWKEVFEVDHKKDMPALMNERDFALRRAGKQAELDEKRVFDDLKRMTRLRLRACDEEGVQIVVETGIGLGVFSGRQLGIDHKVRQLSARAVQEILEKDGPSYKSILAVVFALPVFNQSRSHERVPDTYDDFVNEFRTSNYNGRIPVLIADQDMHRLTVAIARRGYIVSELNPADSHGVFGEYWQNRGPAVEEKLALTTVGLLVQHHLINEEVLNPKYYKLIDILT
ncbi:unnamed protein product [Adineta ricciae]|uniref:Uncharacterized protein n=1 Tax=Adineta ricciae TaxID=249248 RepID=A0A813RVB2_ADIRI|nr:unnamed protein product [Adineta ricciae]